MKRASDKGSGTLENRPQTTKGEWACERPGYFVYMPNFLSGMGSVVNPFPRRRVMLYQSRNPALADYNAIRRDWEMVGSDIYEAIKAFEAKYSEALSGQEQLFDPDNPDDSA